MPHGAASLVRAARRLATLALCWGAVGCERDGTVTVLLDGATGRDSPSVYATPVDPSSLAPAASAGARASARASDSASRYLDLVDSARAADEDFRRQRDWLNDEARAMRGLDRRGADYARRWEAWRAREIAAVARRAERDRLRARLARQGAGAGRPTRVSRDVAAAGRLGASLDSLVRAGVARRVPVVGLQATVALPPGRWWLGVARPGAPPTVFVPVRVSARGADTVRIPSR